LTVQETVAGVAKTPWRAVAKGDGSCKRLDAHVLGMVMAIATIFELLELLQCGVVVSLHQ
jgi:hypothetical protein